MKIKLSPFNWLVSQFFYYTVFVKKHVICIFLYHNIVVVIYSTLSYQHIAENHWNSEVLVVFCLHEFLVSKLLIYCIKRPFAVFSVRFFFVTSKISADQTNIPSIFDLSLRHINTHNFSILCRFSLALFNMYQSLLCINLIYVHSINSFSGVYGFAIRKPGRHSYGCATFL